MNRRKPLVSRKGLRRTGGPTRKGRGLRARPSKRARADEPLRPWCEAAIDRVCTAHSQHRHHILPRSAGGTDDASNTIDLCSACHAHIHAHPALAYEMGWLKRRGAA